MAPLPESRKRPGSSLDDKQYTKRQKRHYHHVHSTKLKQQSDIPHILNDPEAITSQLRRSISLVLKTIGFQDSTPEALDGFTFAAEEYMDNLLSYVSTSMEAGRRTQAIPSDFEFALESNLLTLDALVCHLNPPTSKGKKSNALVAPRIEAQTLRPNNDKYLLEQFSLTLRGPEAETRLTNAPKQVQALPSRHTYKSTPAEAGGPKDARTVRERATEESRLNEEALRRLVSTSQNNGKTAAPSGLAATTAYQKCMQMLEDEERPDQGGIGLRKVDINGPPVNAETRYWRSTLRKVKTTKPANGVRDTG